MELVNHPQQTTVLRKHLGLHLAVAYALAIVGDGNWLSYKDLPRDHSEQKVFTIVSDIRGMGLSMPLHSADESRGAASDGGLQAAIDLA